MESLFISLVHDMRVKRKSASVIRLEKKRERYSLFLSNPDQKLVGYVIKFVHFLSASQEIAFDSIIFLHTEAISRILDFCDFVSERLDFNSEAWRLEIDCNAAGVPFAICTSELTLEEVRDVTYSNSAFTQLCLLPGSTNQMLEDEPLMAFQATQFRCSGFAVGSVVNHGLMDGFALQEFAKKLTHVARKGDLAFLPLTDRTCLKARYPLQIKYSHEELAKSSELGVGNSPFMQRNMNLLRNKLVMHNQSEKHVFKLFTLSGKTLGLLKLNAKEGGVTHCSSFIAAVAHVCHARTAAIANINAHEITKERKGGFYSP